MLRFYRVGRKKKFKNFFYPQSEDKLGSVDDQKLKINQGFHYFPYTELTLLDPNLFQKSSFNLVALFQALYSSISDVTLRHEIKAT